MKRIQIFDDNQRFRDSLSMLISVTDDLMLCGIYSEAGNIINKINSDNPDVILMDIDMPEINGIQAVQTIRKQYPELPVIMLTGFDDDQKVFDSICAGASGYLLKSIKPDELISSITMVMNGGAPMSPGIARKVLQLFSETFSGIKGEKKDYGLSKREKEVLTLLVNGKSYKIIAAELNISYETVHSHIKKIYDKLQVNSAAEAISKSLKQRIV